MKYMRTYLVASFCFFSIHLVLSQFQFSYQQSISVNKLGVGLSLPWAGGLNYAQVSEIDIDEKFEYAQEFGIRGVPTLVMLDGNTEIKRKSGVMNKGVLEAWLND